MGCISSKLDINDQHPNIFQVMNVDEMGHFVSPGQLEVTESMLILHQRGKQPTQWPVRCLRKYGFDSEIFSFECGRRCPTGAGIYAFRCRKAEQLFNLVQHNIQMRNLDENMSGLNTGVDFPVPLASTGPVVHRRLPSVSEGYLNPTSRPSLSRPGSVTSNGPVSPSPPLSANDVILEHNNNKRTSIVLEHNYTNSQAIEATSSPPNYINLSLTTVASNENYVNVLDAQRLYMNVNANEINTKEIVPKMDHLSTVPENPEDARHCYANINSEDLELLQNSSDEYNLNSPSQEVNYVELDLQTKENGTSASVVPDSPDKIKKSYATIDFNKTNALSQSVNPRIEEEGSRKTRHNSTIDAVPMRHSNSSSD